MNISHRLCLLTAIAALGAGVIAPVSAQATSHAMQHRHAMKHHKKHHHAMKHHMTR